MVKMEGMSVMFLKKMKVLVYSNKWAKKMITQEVV